MKKKAVLSSLLVIALCLCLIVGGTFALFTDSHELDVAVTAGKVDLTAVYDTSSMLTWSSLYQTEKDARTDGLFDNSGTAKFVTDTNNAYTMVVIDRMTPGDVAKFKIDVENLSNVNVQYRVRMISLAGEHDVDLTEALTITAYIDGFNYPVTGNENASVWRYIDANQPIEDIWVTIAFRNTPMDLSDLSVGNPDNKYQEAQAKMAFVVEAVQGNASTFTVAESMNELTENRGYLPEGIINGEGKTIAVTDVVGLKGSVTLANITVNGKNNPNADGMQMLFDVVNDEDATLVLADGAHLIATDNEYAILSMLSGNSDAFTLIVDETAKISASGSGSAALLAQGWDGDVVNVIMNGSAAQCLNLTNGANGFVFVGEDGTNITVNMFVKTQTDKAQYARLIVAENAIINWFVDGTYDSTTYR